MIITSKLKWKQYISRGKIIYGSFIIRPDCTKTRKIKGRNILHPNSLFINTVICSSLQLQNFFVFYWKKKQNWRKRVEKKRRKYKVQFRVLCLAHLWHDKEDQHLTWNKDQESGASSVHWHPSNWNDTYR